MKPKDESAKSHTSLKPTCLLWKRDGQTKQTGLVPYATYARDFMDLMALANLFKKVSS